MAQSGPLLHRSHYGTKGRKSQAAHSEARLGPTQHLLGPLLPRSPDGTKQCLGTEPWRPPTRLRSVPCGTAGSLGPNRCHQWWDHPDPILPAEQKSRKKKKKKINLENQKSSILWYDLVPCSLRGSMGPSSASPLLMEAPLGPIVPGRPYGTKPCLAQELAWWHDSIP